MGTLSFWHILIILVVVLLLFGRGRITNLMGDLAQGIKSFKRGMSEDQAKPSEEQKTITVDAKAEPVKDATSGTKTS
ncbi:MAG: twin-arginine translocase TatA/TatE family subunit [Alphaproteobacteria bacterium]|nr:twin-arginine translocase TatA/TatE family subunit [Alphaproteobacteria bacterium]